MRRHCRPLRQVCARPRACARLGPGPSHDLGFTVAPDRRELGRGGLPDCAHVLTAPSRQQSRRGWWARPRPQRHRGRRRRLLLRALDAVATCWEKLFALRALDSRGP
ncbi:hypothetical protein MDA_GLEAN10009516 [Myotis davidii]|uniref:Uncharacterized protein n=1 Tax=Myotis davidii TaxID=225400 RepID=L5LIH7_MYODS|nr:hypothetical protein MDA_GLEAN10009516 [Myotis davidii]